MMHIPEKYRDRYDRLALSHPWMREMRDEQPCTFEGEKVQGSDEPPGGDAMAILRNIAADKTDVSIDDLLRYAVGETDEDTHGWLMSPHVDANDAKVIKSGEKYKLAPESEAASHTDGGKVEADTREKLETDVRSKVVYSPMVDKDAGALIAEVNDVVGWLDRQAAITRAECERICDTCEWPDLAKQPDREAYDRIAELQAERDKFSELSTARGRTIETLERILSERKAKYRETLEQKLKHQRNITAERDQYRELYEAAMSTDYAAAARERDKMHDQIKQIRSIITDEKPDDRLAHD